MKVHLSKSANFVEFFDKVSENNKNSGFFEISCNFPVINLCGNRYILALGTGGKLNLRKAFFLYILRRATRIFLGQGRFLGMGARRCFMSDKQKKGPAGDNFGLFSPRCS